MLFAGQIDDPDNTGARAAAAALALAEFEGDPGEEERIGPEEPAALSRDDEFVRTDGVPSTRRLASPEPPRLEAFPAVAIHSPRGDTADLYDTEPGRDTPIEDVELEEDPLPPEGERFLDSIIREARLDCLDVIPTREQAIEIMAAHLYDMWILSQNRDTTIDRSTSLNLSISSLFAQESNAPSFFNLQERYRNILLEVAEFIVTQSEQRLEGEESIFAQAFIEQLAERIYYSWSSDSLSFETLPADQKAIYLNMAEEAMYFLAEFADDPRVSSISWNDLIRRAIVLTVPQLENNEYGRLDRFQQEVRALLEIRLRSTNEYRINFVNSHEIMDAIKTLLEDNRARYRIDQSRDMYPVFITAASQLQERRSQIEQRLTQHFAQTSFARGVGAGGYLMATYGEEMMAVDRITWIRHFNNSGISLDQLYTLEDLYPALETREARLQRMQVSDILANLIDTDETTYSRMLIIAETQPGSSQYTVVPLQDYIRTQESLRNYSYPTIEEIRQGEWAGILSIHDHNPDEERTSSMSLIRWDQSSEIIINQRRFVFFMLQDGFNIGTIGQRIEIVPYNRDSDQFYVDPEPDTAVTKTRVRRRTSSTQGFSIERHLRIQWAIDNLFRQRRSSRRRSLRGFFVNRTRRTEFQNLLRSSDFLRELRNRLNRIPNLHTLSDENLLALTAREATDLIDSQEAERMRNINHLRENDTFRRRLRESRENPREFLESVRRAGRR